MRYSCFLNKQSVGIHILEIILEPWSFSVKSFFPQMAESSKLPGDPLESEQMKKLKGNFLFDWIMRMDFSDLEMETLEKLLGRKV